MRDTHFFGMSWLKTLENQIKCQSNVFDTVFTNNIYSYLLCVVADNMEQCRYNILAQNISKGFQWNFIEIALFGKFEEWYFNYLCQNILQKHYVSSSYVLDHVSCKNISWCLLYSRQQNPYNVLYLWKDISISHEENILNPWKYYVRHFNIIPKC